MYKVPSSHHQSAWGLTHCPLLTSPVQPSFPSSHSFFTSTLATFFVHLLACLLQCLGVTLMALCSGITPTGAQWVICGADNLTWIGHMHDKCPMLGTALSSPLSSFSPSFIFVPRESATKAHTATSFLIVKVMPCARLRKPNSQAWKLDGVERECVAPRPLRL